MTKKLLLGSMVAAALIFTGCGDDDDTTTPAPAPTVDTENPVVNATATAAVDSAVTLATDNVGVTEITLSGAGAAGFTVSGTTVTTPATAGNYIVTVSAKDAAGNTGTGDVNVTVTGGTPAPTPTGIVSGGLEWTALKVDDDASADDGRVLRDAAIAACPAGTTLPTYAQLDDANWTDLATKFDLANINGGNDVPVWIEDNATTIFAIEVAGTGGYAATPDAGDSNFFTCVKAAN